MKLQCFNCLLQNTLPRGKSKGNGKGTGKGTGKGKGKVKDKGKFTLEQVTKAQRGSRSIILLFI
jgi:hypothetical protein